MSGDIYWQMFLSSVDELFKLLEQTVDSQIGIDAQQQLLYESAKVAGVVADMLNQVIHEWPHHKKGLSALRKYFLCQQRISKYQGDRCPAMAHMDLRAMRNYSSKIHKEMELQEKSWYQTCKELDPELGADLAAHLRP